VASLDPATAQQVLSLLHRICKDENIAAVVSLHQVHFARSYADRIVGLTQGRVVFDGPPDALAQAALERIYAAKAGTAATHDVKEAGVGAGLPLPPILPLQPSS
jgi:phosphonate transport system ATP-binding protein